MEWADEVLSVPLNREDGLACFWQPRSSTSSPVRLPPLMNGIQEAAAGVEGPRSPGGLTNQNSGDISTSSASVSVSASAGASASERGAAPRTESFQACHCGEASVLNSMGS